MALQNVMATALTSDIILVSWQEMSAICQNGNVTTYEVQYEPLETFGVLVSQTINTTAPATMTNITGLEEYVEYDITVRAYTSVGPGPYSDPPITERTLEDGKK